jgi:hypothetical protein
MLGSALRRLRLVYYPAVALVAVGFHQGFVADLLGPEASDFLRRNSEAYVLMLLVPAYWDFVRLSEPPPPTDSETLRWAGWYATLVAAVVVLQTDMVGAVDLPQSLVTLGEAFVAATVVSLYLDWSRGGFPGRWWGRAPRPRHRVWYYAACAGFTVLVYQGFVRDVIGGDAVEWLQVNAEAYAAVLLVPAYFDVVRPTVTRFRRPWWTIRAAWYGVLLAFPLFIQTSAAESLLGEALAGWFGQTTEAFLAAIVISLYVDVADRAAAATATQGLSGAGR